jgi:hypothetical protein
VSIIVALLAPALFDVLEMARPPMVCAFPGAEAPGLPREVRIVDPELEMTTNGQFKVGVSFGTEVLHGRVAPYEKSDARDVVVRARAEDEAVYLIALRDDGTALMRYRPAEDGAEVLTSQGSCTGFEALLNRWLQS